MVQFFALKMVQLICIVYKNGSSPKERERTSMKNKKCEL